MQKNKDTSKLRIALEASVKLQSHYANLLNMYDGGMRYEFANVDEWIARLIEIGNIPNVETKLTPEAWATKTMDMINKLTPDIKGKAFDPDWFLLREKLEEAGRVMDDNDK